MRLIKGFIAAVLAISMTSAPVLAQSAAPLSLGGRAGVSIEDGNTLISEDNLLLPAFVLIAVLAAAILLSKEQGDDDFDNPTSP